MKAAHPSLVRKALFLSWFTILYNMIEGLISIRFGMHDNSIALLGFGADSWIEVASAALVLWRFRSEVGRSNQHSIDRETKATLGIGILFVSLALGTAVASVLQLLEQSHPQSTLPGLIISLLSLSFMFFLWSEKKKVAMLIDSQTVMKDASCSLACIKLSVILLSGSMLFLLFPSLWWADSLAALILAFFIGKEGLETIIAARKEDFSGGCCGCSD